jgi:hypothetical protein
MKITNPIELITPYRFDVIIKYMYAKSIVRKLNTEVFKNFYKEHLRLWNGFKEYDNPNKNTFEAFDEEFKKIVNSFQINGFDSTISQIPALEGKYIVNGAHRLAAALATNNNVVIREANMPHDGQKDCSWKSHFSAIGLPQNISDRTALEYAKLNKNTYVLTLFPTARGEFEKAIEIINRYGKLVYYKKLELKKHAPLNLMREFYAGEAWAGGPHDNWHGFRMKEGLCFTNDSPTYVFLIELDHTDIGRSVKNDIRNIYGVGNHSCHINDTHEQTIRLAQVVFNEKSLHHLTHSTPVHYAKFEKALSRFKKFIIDNNLDVDDYAITASSVLSIYGLREGSDLDYIHYDSALIQDPENIIHSHNEYGLGLYPLSYEEIIFNPEFHFYSNGLKFVSPRIIRDIKTKRNEPKDILDINLIDSIL